MTTKILRNDAKLWETWIYNFAECNMLVHIEPFIPIENPSLSSSVYEMVLSRYLIAENKVSS